MRIDNNNNPNKNANPKLHPKDPASNSGPSSLNLDDSKLESESYWCQHHQFLSSYLVDHWFRAHHHTFQVVH